MISTRSRLSGKWEIYVTHQQLADDIGTAREVITRLLKKFEQEGKIETSRGKIILKNPPV